MAAVETAPTVVKSATADSAGSTLSWRHFASVAPISIV